MPEILKVILSHTDLFISGFVGICVAGGVILEASPLPINPLKWLGNRLNQDIRKELSCVQTETKGMIGDLKEELSSVKNELEEEKNERIKSHVMKTRTDILDFANSIRNGRRHTAEEYDHVIDLIDEYEAYCEKYNIKNGKLNVQAKFIVETYMKLARDGQFERKLETGELL